LKGQKDPEYSIVLNKCFIILRIICENKNYVTKYHKEFEAIFKQLYDYLKNPKKIEFDEDLVMMLSSTMKHLHVVSQYTFDLLQYLPKYLKKSKGMMKDLFDFMNQLIFYGHDTLVTNEQYLDQVYQIFELSCEVPMLNECSDKSSFLGALLMQTFITVNKN